MTPRLKVWQCIGCGRIDDPQPCVGVCRDQKLEIVLASEHDKAISEIEERVRPLVEFLQRITHTTPRGGEWERSYRALQDDARKALERWRGGQ